MTPASLTAAPRAVNALLRRSVHVDGDKIPLWELLVPTSFVAKGDTAVVRLLTPLAAWAALWSFAAFRLDPSAAAEGRFLAILAGGVLLCAALVSRSALDGLAMGAVLTTAAGWLLPYGPVRGSAVVIFAGGTLAWALAGRWWELEVRRAWLWAAPAAVGAQLLFHTEILLPDGFGPRALVTLLVVPAAGAFAAVLACRGRDPRSVALAVGVGLVVAQGWSLLLVLGLLAWVAGEELQPRDPWPAVALGVLAGGALVAGWEPREALLVAVLAGVGRWASVSGLEPAPAAKSGLEKAQETGRRRWAVGLGGPLLVLAALELLPSLAARPSALALSALAVLPLLLPRLVLLRPGRALLLALASFAALRVVPGDGTLAPILAVAALGLPAEGPGARLERGWIALLAALSTLTAAYPWLRAPAMDTTFDLLGLGTGWIAAGAVIVAGGLLGLGAGPGERRGPAAATAACALLAVLAALQVPAGGPDLLPAGDQLLEARHPNWGTDLEPQTASALVVDSTLAFGAALAPGTPVATLRCFHDDGTRSEWALETGRDTGEWAARRSDVRAAGSHAPSPFSTAVAPDGRFLGQRYRAVFAIEGEHRVRRVSVLRRPDLPPEVQLSLLRVELRP